jgi:hypothetical protein
MEQGTRETGEEATVDGGGAGGAGRAAGIKRPRICWDQILPRKSLRVLLVEHDDSTRQVVTALLRKCSYHGKFSFLSSSKLIPLLIQFKFMDYGFL